nr:uncharacterized protein LOC119618619 [Chlorocebus sabaeus]
MSVCGPKGHGAAEVKEGAASSGLAAAPPRGKEPLSGLAQAGAAPSACREVWRERHRREPGLCGRSQASASSGWAWAPRAPQSGWHRRPRAVRGLTSGPAAAEGALGPPAVLACRHCAHILPGRQLPPCGAGLGICSPPCPSLPSRPALGSCAAQASPASAAPCPTAPGPIDCPRAEECGRTAGDWWAAPPAALVRDPLGEANWAPESSRDLKNLYV